MYFAVVGTMFMLHPKMEYFMPKSAIGDATTLCRKPDPRRRMIMMALLLSPSCSHHAYHVVARRPATTQDTIHG